MPMKRFIQSGYLFGLLSSLALVAIGCGEASSSSTDTPNAGHKARANDVLEWSVRSVSPPRRVTVGGGVGYCVGDPKPRIDRPQIRYQDASAYIMLRVRESRHEPSEESVCADVELFVSRTITLRRNVADIKLYDSGVEPPRLRWP